MLIEGRGRHADTVISISCSQSEQCCKGFTAEDEAGSIRLSCCSQQKDITCVLPFQFSMVFFPENAKMKARRLRVESSPYGTQKYKN